MSRIFIAFLFAFSMCLGLAGCAEKHKVQETKKVETPGGTTTQTTTEEVKKTGDNPPPANP